MLGFDARLLESRFAGQDCEGIPNCAAFPITYDDAALRTIHQKIVDGMFRLISFPCGRNLPEAVLCSYWEQLFVLLASQAMHASLFFKHEAYKNEQEYRLLQVYKAGHVIPDMRSRMRPYSIVKHLEFGWKTADQGVLKKIVAGPAADSKSKRFAKDCNDMFYSGKASIDYSKIPYRGR